MQRFSARSARAVTVFGLAGLALSSLALACPDGPVKPAAHACTSNHHVSHATTACGHKDAADGCVPAGVDDAVGRLVAWQTFHMLPASHRAIIAAAGAEPEAPVAIDRGDQLDPGPGPWDSIEPAGDEEYALVADIVTREQFDAMRPIYQHALAGAVRDRIAGLPPAAMCFAPGTDPVLVEAFDAAVFGRGDLRFQQTARWSVTATTPPPINQGDQIVLTYSFVPDGTFVPSRSGLPSGSSNLFQFLNGIYASPEAWQAFYHEIFARWGELCGVTYVFEPNDDGSTLHNNAGVLGVRGDLRMAGIPLDGNSGVLAYNVFPNGGDMVIDTADGFYNNTSARSRRLRNILYHEHGHGMGQLHVCPANETKLMEPFISVAYEGPQLDDILNAQRHYGDGLEPNDTPWTATALDSTTYSPGIVQTISIDGTSDVDYFELTVEEPAVLNVRARPTGATYLEGTQTQSCSGGSPFDSLRVNALRVQLIAGNGTTVLRDSGLAALSQVAETSMVVPPGTYYALVTGGTVDNIQAYRFEHQLSGGPAAAIALPEGAPSLVPAGTPAEFPVSVLAISDTIVPGSVAVYSRPVGTEAYQRTELSGEFGGYTAVLPAISCGSDVEFYIEALTVLSGRVTLPENAPTNRFVVSAGEEWIAFEDDFEEDRGWIAGMPGDTATAGQWERGRPNPTIAQPGSQTTPGGENCYFTGQAPPGAADGVADVDDGFTTLLSPVIDLSGAQGATVSYFRWYDNSRGAAPQADIFVVDVSADGGQTWTRAETVGPTGPQVVGGWLAASWNVEDFVPLTANVRVRFIASDLGAASLVEAAVDDFVVRAFACTDPPVCPADFNGDGAVTTADITAYLSAWFDARASGQTGTADFNDDGAVTTADITAYLSAWFDARANGC